MLNIRTLSASARAVALALTGLSALSLSAAAVDARSLEEAKASGKLIIGIQADNCPWGCLDSTGTASGFDPDMARAFASHLGLDIEFLPLAVANRIPALTAQKVDGLIASLGMTVERAQTVQFSHPYAANTLYVTAPKTTKLASEADLAGLSVGVPRSAPMDTNLTRIAPSGTDIRRFDDDAANIQALLSGQVAAVGSNQFYMQRLEATKPGVYEDKFQIGQLLQGIGTRKGEADWNEAANAFLADFIGTDEYRGIYEKWLKLTPPDYPEQVEGIPFTTQ